MGPWFCPASEKRLQGRSYRRRTARAIDPDWPSSGRHPDAAGRPGSEGPGLRSQEDQALDDASSVRFSHHRGREWPAAGRRA